MYTLHHTTAHIIRASINNTTQLTIFATGTVFVRGAALETVIEKVRFILHPTFGTTKPIIDQPPFELTRKGWGMFEIGIEVCFALQKDKSFKEITKQQQEHEHEQTTTTTTITTTTTTTITTTSYREPVLTVVKL